MSFQRTVTSFHKSLFSSQDLSVHKGVQKSNKWDLKSIPCMRFLIFGFVINNKGLSATYTKACEIFS